MLGPAIDEGAGIIVLGGGLTALLLALHCCLSSIVEHRFSMRHRLWEGAGIPVAVFYEANGLTYGLISMGFAYEFIQSLNSGV